MSARRIICAMALYEYFCRECETSFEARRPMRDADLGVTCPEGHLNVRRKISVFAAVGALADAGPASFEAASAGGCCGGACGCGH
jgi:putative FmdB family regulatory protein